jgi:hypothetical protein
MAMDDYPTGLPVLARGKHVSAEDGACFMEYASMLAGTAWSDEPPCTHPVLAAVARTVNDATTDANRSALAPLVPAVIATNGDDPRVAPTLVAICATAALSRGRRPRRLLRRTLTEAADLLASGAGWPSGGDVGLLRRGMAWLGLTDYRYRRSAERAVSLAVASLAPRPAHFTDAPLRELLERCITQTRELLDEARSGAAGARRPASTR